MPRRKKNQIDPTLGRNELLEQFYKLNEKGLRKFALHVIPVVPNLTSRASVLRKEDVTAILESLHCRFEEYLGPAHEENFVEWAEGLIRDAVTLLIADRFVFVAELHRKYGSIMRSGIRSVTSTTRKYEDWAQNDDDLYSTLITHTLLRSADKFRSDSTAKLKRRLYRLAEIHAITAIHQTDRQGCIVTERIRQAPEVSAIVDGSGIHKTIPDGSQVFGCEAVNPIDLASFKRDELKYGDRITKTKKKRIKR